MKKILLAGIAWFSLIYTSMVSAASFTGDMQIYFPGSPVAYPAGNISGDIDLDNYSISVTDIIFIGPATVQSAELLPPGSYQRIDYFGNSYSINVGPDQVGGYFEIISDVFGGPYSIATLWDRTVQNNNVVLTLVDGDNDGIPGFAYTQGPFAFVTVGMTNLVLQEPVPRVAVTLNVVGGSQHECSITGGDNVAATVDINLINGAVLDTITWTVDGQVVSQENAISEFVSLGSHTIEVTATTLSGASDSASASVTVIDTQPPVIDAAFIDNRSGTAITSIETRNTSFVNTSIKVSDICDPSPYVHAFGGFELIDGDTLKIQGNLDKVELNTNHLEMLVQASDGSNNQAQVIKTLTISP